MVQFISDILERSEQCRLDLQRKRKSEFLDEPKNAKGCLSACIGNLSSDVREEDETFLKVLTLLPLDFPFQSFGYIDFADAESLGICVKMNKVEKYMAIVVKRTSPTSNRTNSGLGFNRVRKAAHVRQLWTTYKYDHILVFGTVTAMRTPGKTSFFSTTVTTTATFFYVGENEQNTPPAYGKTIEIPIQSPSSVSESDAAIKIQSAYRSHRVRTLVRKIWAVNSDADRFERLIQQQETVDAVRGNEREKLRMNETLMSMLLQLDSVPGICPSVRELRRWVSRRIVVLQEVLDAVADAEIAEPDGFLRSWDEMFESIEERVCEEEEKETGFECLQRLLMMG